ncbi:MAG: S9 family peptidase, partial [Acidobacteriota bacterium]|nr:S9 family peptidase [Acidobacteriota bacterium]
MTLLLMAGKAGEPQQVTPADLNIYEYDWSPGGDEFAAIAAPGPADNNWWTAKLYTVAGHSGQMKMIYAPPVEQQLAAPHWSPDGSRIGFIGGLMSDEGFNGGDIFVLSKSDGAPKNLTEGKDETPTGFQWRNDQALLYTAVVDGGGAIATLNVENGQKEVLWKGG